eukprot:766064-Hanusia_phi.AAC.3
MPANLHTGGERGAGGQSEAGRWQCSLCEVACHRQHGVSGDSPGKGHDHWGRNRFSPCCSQLRCPLQVCFGREEDELISVSHDATLRLFTMKRMEQVAWLPAP